jgi:hypothetical protein
MSQTQAERDAAMERFLANGGKIQQVATNTSGRSAGYSAWGAPKKGRKAASETPTIDPEEDDELIG